MPRSLVEALKAYIDAKADEAAHLATHGCASSKPSEDAWRLVELELTGMERT